MKSFFDKVKAFAASDTVTIKTEYVFIAAVVVFVLVGMIVVK